MDMRTVDSLVVTVRAQLEEHAQALREGKSLKLDGLEERTRSLCQAIAALPREEAERYESVLHELIGKISDLTKAMEAEQKLIVQKVDELSKRVQGQQAYLKTAYLSSKHQDNSSDN